MRTEDLVTLLATGAEPVPRHAVGRRYAIAIGLGALVSGALMLSLLGLRPDLAEAVNRPMFWVKLGFVASLAWGGLVASMRLSRPGANLDHSVPAALIVPVFAMWAIAGVVLVGADPAVRPELIFGATWKRCPWIIALLSLPVFVAVLWAMRGLAPTRLPLAATAAGLLAGSVGALVYCLHCPELEAPFLGTWYVLGILIPVLGGSLVGPRLLRW
jgi:hypothetical protein